MMELKEWVAKNNHMLEHLSPIDIILAWEEYKLRTSVESEPIKLYGDTSETDPLKRLLVDADGRKYETMVGGITLCDFVGFEKLFDAGISMHISELPINEQGQVRVRVEIRDLDQSHDTI